MSKLVSFGLKDSRQYVDFTVWHNGSYSKREGQPCFAPLYSYRDIDYVAFYPSIRVSKTVQDWYYTWLESTTFFKYMASRGMVSRNGLEFIVQGHCLSSFATAYLTLARLPQEFPIRIQTAYLFYKELGLGSEEYCLWLACQGGQWDSSRINYVDWPSSNNHNGIVGTFLPLFVKALTDEESILRQHNMLEDDLFRSPRRPEWAGEHYYLQGKLAYHSKPDLTSTIKGMLRSNGVDILRLPNFSTDGMTIDEFKEKMLTPEFNKLQGVLNTWLRQGSEG